MKTSPSAVSHGRARAYHNTAAQTPNTHTHCNLTIAASEGGYNMSSLVTSGPKHWGSLSRKQWHPWQETNPAALYVVQRISDIQSNRGVSNSLWVKR